jgi:hypothetical protein
MILLGLRLARAGRAQASTLGTLARDAGKIPQSKLHAPRHLRHLSVVDPIWPEDFRPLMIIDAMARSTEAITSDHQAVMPGHPP